MPDALTPETLTELEVAALKEDNDWLLARLTNRERDKAERLAEAASIGDTGICRTCTLPITYEADVDRGPGYLPRTGWTDHARVDPLVCFKAIDYRHVPLVDRERAIWDKAVETTRAALDVDTAGHDDSSERDGGRP